MAEQSLSSPEMPATGSPAEACPSQALQVASSPVEHPAFDQFVATIAALRAPDGCPWDREQTHQSIAHNMIEEAYEAVDAIEANDVAHLREELGDVLLQVVLQSQIAADAGEFDINDVTADVNAKMVRRHPHVFGDAKAGSAGEVLNIWDQVKVGEQKAAEKADGDGTPQSLLASVPTGFPALMQAQKISRKAAAAGFEWDTLGDVWDKVDEEISELKEAYELAPKDAIGKVDGAYPLPEEARALGLEPDQAVASVEMEFGDVLFALVNVARRMGINAENSLRMACTKFRARWSAMEAAAAAQGQRIEDLSTAEQNVLWDAVKEQDA